MTEVVVDLSAGTLLSLASSSERRPGPGYREAVSGVFFRCGRMQRQIADRIGVCRWSLLWPRSTQRAQEGYASCPTWHTYSPNSSHTRYPRGLRPRDGVRYVYMLTADDRHKSRRNVLIPNHGIVFVASSGPGPCQGTSSPKCAHDHREVQTANRVARRHANTQSRR